MNGQTSNAQRKRLKEAAANFRSRGYEVWLDPDGSVLPDLPRNLRPDMVAKRGDETVIVEVESGESLKTEKTLSQLARFANQLPGARVELIVTNPRDEPEEKIGPRVTREFVTRRIALVSELAKQHDAEASALLAWVTLEAILRDWAERENIRIRPALGPTGLVKTIYSYGLISEDEMQSLLRVAESRDAIVHGRNRRPMRAVGSLLGTLLAKWERAVPDDT